MHFIHGLSGGGAETLVKNYMLNFDARANKLVLMCLEHTIESSYEKQLSDAGIRMIFIEDYLPFCKQNNVFARFVKHYVRFLIVRKILRKENPDILHTHLTVNRFVKFAKLNKNVRMVHTIHSEPKKLWINGRNANKYDFKSTKYLVNRYNMQLITLHDKMKNEIEKMFDVSNVIVLNNGINIVDFKNMKSKNVMRKKIGINSDAFVVGHVGRFSEVKNHEFLIEIFKKIKNPNKFLLMVGNGEKKEKTVQKLHSDGLDGKYLILSNRDDIPDLLATMDVFVFPSKYEGLGISLVEAQESKLPCFVSDTVPEHATISNLVTRLSFDDRPKKWAEAIESYQKPKKIIANDENWDIKKITKRLENIYAEALAEKKNGKK